MNVSRRVILFFLLSAFLLSSGVSLIVQTLYHSSEQHVPQAVALVFVLVLIAVAGKLLQYNIALKQAKQNLDEAQQLAGLGSWERDLVSGRGYWSDNHYKLFNLQPRTHAPSMEEFLSMILAEDRFQASETVMEAIRSGTTYEMKYRLENDDNKRIFLSRGKVLHDDSGKAVTLVGTVQDITHKHRRDQFREDLLRQKDVFINRLGHDLKTPLTPLVALLPLVRSRTTEQRQQELLDLCINSVTHINDLVTKTLQLARLASSSSDVISRKTDLLLSAVIDAAAERMTVSKAEHQLAIVHSVAAGVIVRGNRSELEELFMQLFSNADKFSAPGSQVIVGAVSDGTVVTVTVADNGIGLSPEELPHIFEDFYKADHSRHLLSSSGLGLSICRRIVENHGGRISVSSPGKESGTTFSFTLEAGGSV